MSRDTESLHKDVMELLDGDQLLLEEKFADEHKDMDGDADEGDNLEETTLHDPSYRGAPDEQDDGFMIVIQRGYKQRGRDGDERVYDMNYEGSEAFGSYIAYGKFLKKEFPDEYEQLISEYDHKFE